MSTFLVPWPLHHLQLVWNRRPRATEKHRAYTFVSSGWLTVSIALWLYMALVVRVTLQGFAQNYAADASKALLSGAFLLGTILSVSVAMPGQAVMKVVIGKRPSFAIQFVVPFSLGVRVGHRGRDP